jgi:hypothetical protein
MPRLYRPTISLSVKCAVAKRQLEASGINPISTQKLSTFLFLALDALARVWSCDRRDLRLDHDPPLGARCRSGEGKQTVYAPPANDPDHLFYRPHGPEFAGSHLIKTNCRGDHGQHPDRVLIKKMRRIERGPQPKRPHSLNKNPKAPKPKWPSRPFPSKGRK